MNFQINRSCWRLGQSSLRLFAKFTSVINSQMTSQRSGVKVIQLSTYHVSKLRGFCEASNGCICALSKWALLDVTKCITSYILHHSALEEALNWVCSDSLSRNSPKVVYSDSWTEKSTYVQRIPQTKGRRRYTVMCQLAFILFRWTIHAYRTFYVT